MIDTIGLIVSAVLGVSALTLCSFFVLLVDRASKLRYDDRVDNDRLAQIYWMITRVSGVVFLISWVVLAIVCIIDSATK